MSGVCVFGTNCACVFSGPCSAVSAEEREHVGRLCKMLINHGRLHYLQQKGFTSSLRYYTSRDVSLENVLLTALPS